MYVLKLKYFCTEDIRISWLTRRSFGVVVVKFASNTYNKIYITMKFLVSHIR